MTHQYTMVGKDDTFASTMRFARECGVQFTPQARAYLERLDSLDLNSAYGRIGYEKVTPRALGVESASYVDFANAAQGAGYDRVPLLAAIRLAYGIYPRRGTVRFHLEYRPIDACWCTVPVLRFERDLPVFDVDRSLLSEYEDSTALDPDQPVIVARIAT